ncbi:MAG: ABC transporter ATP-binding protein, partial [Lachnospiraceae bacterium]|nr:ABC transporter ATP-binding protein [Lachnospiraceae bacterium]
ISIVCGQLEKDAGKVYVCGTDIDTGMMEIKGRIGVVFQECVLDKVLSVKDNLVCRAALYGITGDALKKRLDELGSLLQISDLMNRTVGKLSGGQRRRIDIARALIHEPEILILDEPTTGLDPQTRNLIWDVIDKLRKETNMTVLLTTHYMEEATPADYVVIIDSGKIAAEGTPLMLKNTYSGDYVTIYGITEEEAKRAAGDRKMTALRDGWQIEVKDTAEATEMIVENRELFKDYEITKGAMDSVFLAVTGKSIGKEGN